VGWGELGMSTHVRTGSEKELELNESRDLWRERCGVRVIRRTEINSTA